MAETSKVGLVRYLGVLGRKLKDDGECNTLNSKILAIHVFAAQWPCRPLISALLIQALLQLNRLRLFQLIHLARHPLSLLLDQKKLHLQLITLRELVPTQRVEILVRRKLANSIHIMI